MQDWWNTKRTMKAPSNNPYNNQPIGVFDSGIGGLTVVKELIHHLPHESIIYFGDTARIPYGTKSEKTIQRFALEDSIFLLDHQVKMVIVACNTASAVALPLLQRILPVPVIGVIEAGAKAAIARTRNGRIGLIGTATTIRTRAYHNAIRQLSQGVQILDQACPLLVPLVEEGWIEDDATYLITRRYLLHLQEHQIDTLILGCTHYPLLKPVFRHILGEQVTLIDSGEETARLVAERLKSLQLQAAPTMAPQHRFYISDLPYKFQEIGERFLQQTLPHVETIHFEQFLTGKGTEFWASYEQLMLKKTEELPL